MHWQPLLRLLCLFPIIVGSFTLSAAPEPNPSFIARQNFGARLEVPDRVLHGAGQDIDSFLAYSAAMDPAARPQIYMTYVGLNASTDSIARWGRRTREELARVPQMGITLQIGLSMVAGKDNGSAVEDEVAAGRFDEQIATFTREVSGFGRPAFVRIGYEFNGHWNGYKPATYRAAFDRVAQALRKSGAPVATVWCAAISTGRPLTLSDILAYAPDPTLVDWWALDLFNAEDLSPGGLADEFCRAAAQAGRPVMIGESTPRLIGAKDGSDAWTRWFQGYFAFIHRQPSVKAFCYINWDWPHWSDRLGFKWHDWGDARLQSTKEVLPLYQKEMAQAWYHHAQSQNHRAGPTGITLEM